jgi:hypothetical protein
MTVKLCLMDQEFNKGGIVSDKQLKYMTNRK